MAKTKSTGAIVEETVVPIKNVKAPIETVKSEPIVNSNKYIIANHKVQMHIKPDLLQSSVSGEMAIGTSYKIIKEIKNIYGAFYKLDNDMYITITSINLNLIVVFPLYFVDKAVYPPVEDWLSAFVEAEMVVTDSFHGTVFSIIFNKPFICLNNAERGSARFESLLGNLGLIDRLVDLDKIEYEGVLDLLNKKIDYTKVESELDKLRVESLKYLKSIC